MVAVGAKKKSARTFSQNCLMALSQLLISIKISVKKFDVGTKYPLHAEIRFFCIMVKRCVVFYWNLIMGNSSHEFTEPY